MPTARLPSPPGTRLLLEDGVVATGLGLVLLAAPALFANYSVMQTLALGFRLPGWLALGAGVLLLGYYALVQRRAEPATAAPPPAPTRRPAPPTQWRPGVLRAVEWRRFEAVCEALFAQAGLTPRALPRSGGRGTDIWLHSRHAEGPVAVLRCQQSLNRPVPLRALRDLQQLMAARGLRRGSFATASTLAPEALDFAQAHGIHVLDGPSLLLQIAKRTPEQQQALLDVAYAGEYWRPSCAACNDKLTLRPASLRRAAYWRCAPCKLRLPIRAE